MKNNKKIRGGNVYQLIEDVKSNDKKHDWYFEFANCDCGPIHGRDNARKVLNAFKQDYVKLLNKYHGGNSLVGIFIDD